MNTQRVDDEVQRIVSGTHGHPFSFLGMHDDGKDRVVLRAFLPDAERIGVADPATNRVVGMLARVHREGVFEGRLCSSRSGPMQQRSNETVFMSTTRGF